MLNTLSDWGHIAELVLRVAPHDCLCGHCGVEDRQRCLNCQRIKAYCHYHKSKFCNPCYFANIGETP